MSEAAADSLRAYVSAPARVLSASGSLASAPASREVEVAGAEHVHLAEPAETAARRGPKRRATTDRADARHLRELLIVGRLPESWIPPDHLLDLRARVRLRHTLIDQRASGSSASRRCSITHGFPQRRELLTGANRAWLAELKLSDSAREQIVVGLRMLDALDAQAAPITAELRAYDKRQNGCRALMEHYGVGKD